MKITTAIFQMIAKVGELFAPRVPQLYHEPWQRTQAALLPPMEIQTTGGMRLPICDGAPWPGPAGSLVAVTRGTSFYRRRETGVLIPLGPVQSTSPIQRLRTRLDPIPETIELPDWCKPGAQAQRVAEAIAKLDSGRLGWLYEDVPVLAPLATDALSVSDRIAQPYAASEPTTDAFEELLRHDSGTLEIPAIMRKKHVKESE